MRLGVMSDIHGNRVALDAVLADAREVGVDAWWVLGDLVAIGPEPVATLERIAELPSSTVIRGNTDRYVLTGDRPPPHPEDALEQPELLEIVLAMEASFSRTRGSLSPTGWLGWLDSLPADVRLTRVAPSLACRHRTANAANPTSRARPTAAFQPSERATRRRR